MIYLDNHATTQVDPRVLEAMLPYFTDKFGNAASVNHAYGHAAREAVEAAREQVASLIHATPKEIVFTSGATEANNLAIKGVDGPVVTVATEHPSVLDACPDATILPVDENGLLDPGVKIPDGTKLVSIMHANNEIGVIQPIDRIDRRGALLHTDAAQSVGKIPFDAQGVDLASLTAHKIYGPKGVGALYVSRRVRLNPQMDGGGHEQGMRSGTLPVPLIVGFGLACEIAEKEREEESKRILGLRERLRSGIFDRMKNVGLNGSLETRLPGNLNIWFEGVEGGALVEELQIAVSTGSACSTDSPEVSHVLRALGLPEPKAARSIRFGIGRFNTRAEIDETIDRVVATVGRLQKV